ncbi:hypothetical protein MN116_007214 [Schistosoma mekongi]|uniref:Uncharacterized protein n=1 Tax=Schistosoma mekongi TaxID=38744 RepID=A0AAE2D326_SCHME|nr:hypothetical protein MN116_007214 [Schistosoma mekongi]
MTKEYQQSLERALIRLLDYSLITQMSSSNTDGKQSIKHSRYDSKLNKAPPKLYHNSRNSRNEDPHLKYMKAVGSWFRKNTSLCYAGGRRRSEVFRMYVVFFFNYVILTLVGQCPQAFENVSEALKN